MIAALKIMALLALVSISYQDFRYRGVYWILFPVLSLLFLLIKYRQTGWDTTWQDAAYGMGFLILQLILVWLYFIVKERKLVNVIDSYIGLGDILFLVVLAFYLSPVNYVLFYIFSLVLVLVYVLAVRNMTWIDHKHIPLAGLQSAFLSMLILWDMITSQLDLYKDAWIYKTWLSGGL